MANDPDDSKPPIKIEAYVSNNVPSEFVKTKYDLVNLLREFDVLGRKSGSGNLHQGIEPFSEEAILAEKKYGIRPTRVSSQSRGAVREEEVVLGVAFSCGRERIVIPFMPYGMPVEYELMRSINTVANSERKTIGILQSDALVMGAAMNSNGETVRIPRLRIIAELQKQYNVELVEASTPISLWLEDEDQQVVKRRYDVLLVVQPSKLAPVEMENLIKAIQLGQPTAIFEDPLPNPENFKHVGGTFFPRQLSRVSSENADIQQLWDALDLYVDFVRGQLPDGSSGKFSYVIWQLASENPYPRDNLLNVPERIIVNDTDPGFDPRFSPSHPATRGIEQLYFQFAGDLQPKPKTPLEIEPLITTSKAGRLKVSDLIRARSQEELEGVRGSASQNFAIGAAITGSKADADIAQLAADDQPDKSKTNVIYISDIDILSDFFVQMRNYPIRQGIEYRYQNMSFVLNVIDALANEPTYLGIRNRKVKHVTLEVVEKTYEKAMQEVYDQNQQFEIEYNTQRSQIQNELEQLTRATEASIKKEERKRDEGQPYDAVRLEALNALLQTQRQDQVTKFQAKVQELDNERREKKRRTDLEAELEIQEIQRRFKLAAVIIPPIPPLLVGLIVFTRRRLREREGISKARRLK